MDDNYLKDFNIDLKKVKKHYLKRKDVSNELIELLKNEEKEAYVNLAVGVTNHRGNYSADEHKLGPRILQSNSIDSLFDFAKKIYSKELKVTHLPKTIYQSNLPYLKIGVGSEMATLLRPKKFWVGNVRTIWSHLVIKHEGSLKRANEELQLYRVDDLSSEMAYHIWRDIYLSMESSLMTILEIAGIWADEQNVKPGKKKFIWIDAICSELFNCKNA